MAYGTANKESLTGSVAVIGSREIEDRPVTSVTAAQRLIVGRIYHGSAHRLRLGRKVPAEGDKRHHD